MFFVVVGLFVVVKNNSRRWITKKAHSFCFSFVALFTQPAKFKSGSFLVGFTIQFTPFSPGVIERVLQQNWVLVFQAYVTLVSVHFLHTIVYVGYVGRRSSLSLSTQMA